jgi:hypothetical protein
VLSGTVPLAENRPKRAEKHEQNQEAFLRIFAQCNSAAVSGLRDNELA